MLGLQQTLVFLQVQVPQVPHLCPFTCATKMQTMPESEADRAARASEVEHEQLGAAPDDHEQRTSRCRLSAMFPAVELEVITSVLARSGGDVVLGRGMSRAGGDDGEPTATTPDGGALARVLQRSLEAEVATGEQQLQSDEQQRNELQLHIDEQQLQSEDEQQLQSDEQTAQALQVYNRVTRCLAQPKHGERRWVLYFLP